jgi:septation ring formation regulator EzrA
MPLDEHPTNGWNEWSKHVLKELERLNENYEGLRGEIGKIQQNITELKAARSDVDDIKDWKKRMEESVSPSQLGELRKDVDDLKSFKAKAIAVFVVVQLIITVVLAVFF